MYKKHHNHIPISVLLTAPWSTPLYLPCNEINKKDKSEMDDVLQKEIYKLLENF